ncbi:MAG: cation:proton antiporter [Nitrospinota bacterium]|nr:cation:proton antiporter [Nitrospinota bacterium]
MAESIALIVLLGLFSNHLLEKVRLPGLVGMLLVGVLCGPSFLDMMRSELLKVSADFRMVALIVILLRAGLELRRDTLNRVGKTALVMSVVPAVFEGVAIAALAPMLLGITWLEGAILGAILAAVSPAVVVPLMLKFMDEKRGTEKGIPTMILGASSVDDVFVIVIFTILLGMGAGQDMSVAGKLLEIPESMLAGVALGGLAGYALYRLFDRFHTRATKMTITVVAVAILLTWLEKALHGVVAISALLGVMTIGFVLLEKVEVRAHKISAKLSKVWIFAEILLFTLVGAQVEPQVAWNAGLAGGALILIGLVARSAGVMVSLVGADMNFKEKLFCVVAYTPKATVQAAIGAVPLEAGIAGGEVILAVAALSIIITAPLGAIGIRMAGDRWLKVDGSALEGKENGDENINHVNAQ